MKAMPISISPSSSGDINAADTKKRSRELGDDEGDLSIQDLSKLSCLERKRYHERKRRSHVNRGFDNLMNLLIEIDPKDMLRRANRENEERKVIIMELTLGGFGVGLGGRTAVTNDSVTRMLPMTMLNPSAESLAHISLEHSTSFQQAGLGLAAMRDSGAAAAALFTHRSLNPFGSGSSIPPGEFPRLQGLNPIHGGLGGMLILSSIMVERNRTAMSQTNLRILQDEATTAAAAPAAASQFHSGGQMRFIGLSRQPDKPVRGLPSGHRL